MLYFCILITNISYITRKCFTFYFIFFFREGFEGYVPVEPNEIDSEELIPSIATGQDLNRENERRREEEEQQRRRQEEERRRQQERIEEERLRKDRLNELEPENGEDENITTTLSPETTQRTTRRRPIQENKVEPICKLPIEPEVDVDFDAGYRFGTTTDSRIEFTQIPSKIKRSYDISLQFKTTSSDGVLFYAADSRHTDFIALYLQEGKVRSMYFCEPHRQLFQNCLIVDSCF